MLFTNRSRFGLNNNNNKRSTSFSLTIIVSSIIYHICFILMFCLNLNTVECVSPSSPQQLEQSSFCAKYNCICPNGTQEILCKFSNSTKSINFLDRNTILVDFSFNSLEKVFFGDDLPLNVKSLMLSNNNLKQINEKTFNKLPYLVYLDISNNKIESMPEVAFQNLNYLETFNLSNALIKNYQLNRELCELLSIRVIDLSYLNLADFTLECWKNQEPIVEELYLKQSKNVESSWLNWFPFIGNKLRVLDLTNANIISIDTNLARKMTNLISLSLADNQMLDKLSLNELLLTDNFIGRIRNLNLENINASSASLKFSKILDNTNQTNLTYLDISNNNYNDDLNQFLFNQPKFSKLKSFKASNNKFKYCDTKLIAGTDATLLENLEELDLSFNSLDGPLCLHSIKPIKNLQRLDLSHNKLSALSSDLIGNELIGLFNEMVNLSYVDFSHNSFYLLYFYFNPYHTKIDKFDLSHNNLKYFRFLSYHTVNSAKFPFSINDEESSSSSNSNGNGTKSDSDEPDYDLNDAYEEDDDDNSDPNTNTIVFDNRNEDYDDDERFVLIDELNLSNNHFTQINVQHMFQSIRNIRRLDLSLNPIELVIRLSGDKSMIYKQLNIITNNQTANKNDSSSKAIVQPKVEEDQFTEILCIDELDLSNCKIRKMPNLEHTCINKIGMAYNLLNGNIHLILSEFSIFFMDYLNLQSNNISNIKLLMSKQKFKQDDYTHKNSPFNYYLGSSEVTPNTTLHTYVDLKQNKYFKCDCNLVKLLKENSYIQLLNECFNDEFESQCNKLNNRFTINSLNQKFRIIFIITCILLLSLSFLIIYYMCSDCVKNLQPYERFRFSFSRLISYLRCENKLDTVVSSTVSGTGDRQSSKVHYSILNNETSSSNINLEIHS